MSGFSNLGTLDANDPRNKLWREYVRVVLEARPTGVLFLRTSDRFSKSSEFALLERMHSRAAPSKKVEPLHWGVLNAADYGVLTQASAILIASRVGPVELPKPTHSKDGLEGRPWMGVRSAISGTSWEARDVGSSKTDDIRFRHHGAGNVQDGRPPRRPTPTGEVT
jgi:DNA (cytosine-5)-methyltransferase 1